MSEQEIKQRLEELQGYKEMILREQKEAKIVLMYSNAALQSVNIEEQMLKDELDDLKDIN